MKPSILFVNPEILKRFLVTVEGRKMHARFEADSIQCIYSVFFHYDLLSLANIAMSINRSFIKREEL